MIPWLLTSDSRSDSVRFLHLPLCGKRLEDIVDSPLRNTKADRSTLPY